MAGKTRILYKTPTVKYGLGRQQLEFFLLLALVILADWLFYGERSGLSFPIFLILLAIAGAAMAKHANRLENLKAGLPVLVMATIPTVETLNPLSAIITSVGVISFVLIIRDKKKNDFLEQMALALFFTVTLPFKLSLDAARMIAVRRKSAPEQKCSTLPRLWALPVLLAAIFVGLFAISNPLIGNWFSQFDIFYILGLVDINRLVFVLGMAVLCWPFLRPSIQKLKRLVPFSKMQSTAVSEEPGSNRILNQGMVQRSLLLFNLIFAIQTLLDATYLWAGKKLPDGVTYSEYVHNGTYILIFTSLLAAAFILLVTNEQNRMERIRGIKLLLLVWTAQNVLLVVSTMMRMGLYVEEYALTYLRLSALIWMLLVAIGLGLIIVRLMRGQSNIWLIKTNLISLATILYLTSLTNVPYVIADYNVRAFEQGSTRRLDVEYLIGLGQQAIPVIDRLSRSRSSTNPAVSQRSATSNGVAIEDYRLQIARSKLRQSALRQHENWRLWSFRSHRLVKYLSKTDSKIVSDLHEKL